jgi:hypothetical protein
MALQKIRKFKKVIVKDKAIDDMLTSNISDDKVGL